MDHILENEGKPVPDASSQAAPSSSAPPPSGGAIDVDEDDEDAEALKAVYGGSAAAAAADTAAEAKVCACAVSRYLTWSDITRAVKWMLRFPPLDFASDY